MQPAIREALSDTDSDHSDNCAGCHQQLANSRNAEPEAVPTTQKYNEVIINGDAPHIVKVLPP
eukprot:3092082-Pleurochrysis_carterae.AAC.1